MSDKRSAAARINGAKSRGPVTAEGKARSSRNALKHGLKSEMLVLNHEDRQAFEQLRESYRDEFQPTTQSQADLVETMAAARWRLNRLFMVEGQLLEKEMATRLPEVNKQFREIDPEGRLSCAFETLSQGKALSLYIRYEGQINRTYERAFKHLQQLQSRQTQPAEDPAEEQPNEPKPVLVLLREREEIEPNEPNPAPPADPLPVPIPDPTPDLLRETPA